MGLFLQSTKLPGIQIQRFILNLRSQNLLGHVFWYTVLSTCNQEGAGSVSFTVHFLNILENSWNEEFGINIMGLNSLFLVFFLYYTIFLMIHFVGVSMFWKNQQYVHPLIRLFSAVLCFEYGFILLKLIHYIKFAGDGKGISGLSDFAEVLDLVARVIFILTIMLIALGWTISTEALQSRKYFVLAAVIIYAGCWMGILIWQFAIEDPAAVDYPPTFRALNVTLLVFWFFLALWFLWTSFWNWKREDNPVKKMLYLRLGILYGVWFIALPISRTVSLLVDPWVREKIVVSVAICFSTLAYSVMAFLLWPSRAEEYFAVEKPNVNNTTLQHYEHL